jgi:divalent metal cation (Fe/Co/Zn/Cd) transporter
MRGIEHAALFNIFAGRRKLEPVAIVVLAVIMSFASIQVIYTSIMTIVDFIIFDTQCNQTFYYQDSNSDGGNETALTCGLVSDLKEQLGPCMSGESGPVVELATIVICCVTVGK